MVQNTQANTSQPKPRKQPNQKAAGQKVDRTDVANGTNGDANAMLAAGTLSTAAAEKIDGMAPGKGKRANIFTQASTQVQAQVAEKVTLVSQAKQSLAHAADLYNEGNDKAKEATEIADKAAVSLYQARVKGLASGEEVSAILGDVFGFKQKKDGSPSKTPDGQGEAIRKRVVRAVQAAEHINNGDGGRFFEGLSEDSAAEDGTTLAEVVAALEAGNTSIWTAYEKFAEIKRAHMVKTNAAFDPKRIAALVESLSEEGAAKVIASAPALVAAYGALIDVLQVVGEQAAAIAAANKSEGETKH